MQGADLVYQPHPRKQTRWHSEFDLKREDLTLIDVEAELTKANYKKKFRSLTSWEESEHINQLRIKYV